MSCSGGSPPSLFKSETIDKQTRRPPTRPIHPLARSLTRVDRRHVSAQMLHEMATGSARSLVVIKGRERRVDGRREVWPGDVTMTVRREPVSCDGGALIENFLEEMTILARPAEECYHICSFLWKSKSREDEGGQSQNVSEGKSTSGTHFRWH